METNRRKTTLPNAIPVAAPADKGFFGATIYYEKSESLRELLALVITYDDQKYFKVKLSLNNFN